MSLCKIQANNQIIGLLESATIQDLGLHLFIHSLLGHEMLLAYMYVSELVYLSPSANLSRSAPF